MRRAVRKLRRVDPQRLLLWVPLLAALTGAALFTELRLASPVYLVIQGATVVFSLLALFGPLPLRPVLLAHAPGVHTLFLLMAWGTALYLLPAHSATPMVGLAVVLYLTCIYVFFFMQWPPRSATLRAVAVLATFLVTALPHSLQTLGGSGAFDGAALILTLLFSHGTLIGVLRSFSQARDQLAQERVRARALHELAHRDPLTELLNRRALEQDLARAVQEKRQGYLLAVIDVDGLKRINDTLGHAAGDDLLRRFAAGFARVAAPQGRAYRLSGDEFALLLQHRVPEAAERMVADVTREVRKVYPEAQASVGTARWRSGETVSTWLSRADRAMYRHKKRTAEEAEVRL